MGQVKSLHHDELERRRAYEAEMFDDAHRDIDADDRAWAAAKAAKKAVSK